jgi:hypothetical protein
MVEARREYRKWDAFICAINTVTLAITPMGKAKKEVRKVQEDLWHDPVSYWDEKERAPSA